MRKVPSVHYEGRAKELGVYMNRILSNKNINNVLDIGGTKESTWHTYFSENVRKKIKNVNLPDEDARKLSYKSNSIDAILCFGTLEHIDDDNKAISEMRRVLKKGGFIFVTVPFIELFHESPSDYHRYTRESLLHKFNWLKEIKCDAIDGLGSAIACLLLNSIGRRKLIRGSICAYMFFWIKYMDKYFLNTKDAHESALSLYITGAKK